MAEYKKPTIAEAKEALAKVKYENGLTSCTANQRRANANKIYDLERFIAYEERMQKAQQNMVEREYHKLDASQRDVVRSLLGAIRYG